MSYLIEQCIFPIIDGNQCIGQGFVADGLFFTAAHVVNRWPNCFVNINQQRVILSEIVPIYKGKGDVEHDPKLEDIAIYYFKNAPSFLHLSSIRILKNTDLRSYCIFPSFDHSLNKHINELSVQPVILENLEEDNYIYGKCNRYEGSSGSPLIVGTDVVGIMQGGDDNDLCAFLKPSSFMFPEAVPYNSKVIRMLSALGTYREEPLTPDYFNRKAREQINDAFE